MFSDWGVVTYDGGVDTSNENKSSTFLSFKCGLLQGSIING